MKSKSRITRIEVGRLYNLGNYQNVSYKLTAEVAPGEKPSRVLKNVVFILRAANPRGPVKVDTFNDSVAYLKLSPKEQEKRYSYVQEAKDRRIATRRAVRDAKRNIAGFILHTHQREEAIRLIDRIGEVVHRDAKNDWEENYD